LMYIKYKLPFLHHNRPAAQLRSCAAAQLLAR
jgi:hypothetical protein